MRHSYIVPLLLLLVSVIIMGCSTQKNTAKSRWWHSFNTKYNTYYNATLAYIDASQEKEKGNKDNFTELLPFYTVSNKNSQTIGKGNYDKAIEKCQKAIKLHSIKKRPEWNKKRRKTEADLEWLNRKEYNPSLWKAWIVMGRSQFFSGNFDEAAATFSYMSRLYRTQPAIYGRSQAWLAKSYIEQDMLYDAEDIIRNMQRDSIHWRAQKEWDFTYAEYYLHTKDYDNAAIYVRKAIKHEMRKYQKARLWFLLGQIETLRGNNQEALKAYKRCIRQNPPYETEFNARIATAEVMSGNIGQEKKMIRRLKRMAASDNNKDYLDQVYYAIGNIYMEMKDTANAISAYEKGNTKATRTGIEKGVLLLRLGDIYWDMEKYNDASRCYGEAVGLLDKERKDYEQLTYRSKVLDELVPYTDAVHLQDSLLALSIMDEKSRNAAIDRVIEQVKKKEKEEADKQAEQNASKTMAENAGNQNRRAPQADNTSNEKGGWYFYNPTAVAQGKTAFQKNWGKRDNADNWRRANQTVVAIDNNTEENNEGENDNSEEIDSKDKKEKNDSIDNDNPKNDPHKREYYLEQIPFSDEQKEACHEIIKDGLFNSAVIFKDKLNNIQLSEKAFNRIETQYPEFEKNADVFYHLFLLFSRKGEHERAASYIEKLKEAYPEHEWTVLLTDPLFEENARFGQQIEDSIYSCTYTAFKEEHYGEVKGNCYISSTRFPLGDNRDKFIFIEGLTNLNEGNTTACLEQMQMLVEKFPKSKLAEMAGMIINGVKSGKTLVGGKFDIGDVWSRRSVAMNDNDSIEARELSAERNLSHCFLIVYPTDSVNENHLLFEMARHNFTNFLVRNFNIQIEKDQGLNRMVIKGFRNYDEAMQYARQIRQNEQIMEVAAAGRLIVISEENLPLLGRQYSYDDYDAFYEENLAPIPIENEGILTEPDADHTKTPEDKEQGKGKGEPDEDDWDNIDDDSTVIEEEIIPIVEEEEIVPEETETMPVEEDTVPVEEETVPVEEDTVPVEEEENTETNNEDVIPIEEDEEETSSDDTPVIIIDDEDAEDDEYYDLEGF